VTHSRPRIIRLDIAPPSPLAKEKIGTGDDVSETFINEIYSKNYTSLYLVFIGDDKNVPFDNFIQNLPVIMICSGYID
jgi:hypothetical protein